MVMHACMVIEILEPFAGLRSVPRIFHAWYARAWDAHVRSVVHALHTSGGLEKIMLVLYCMGLVSRMSIGTRALHVLSVLHVMCMT